MVHVPRDHSISFCRFSQALFCQAIRGGSRFGANFTVFFPEIVLEQPERMAEGFFGILRETSAG